MARYKKASMHEGQDKFARLMRLDQLLRTPEGRTLNEILTDPQIDEINERLLRENLKELEEKYDAVYENAMYRGRERLWRYKDTNFSIFQQTSKDMEIIRHSLKKLSTHKKVLFLHTFAHFAPKRLMAWRLRSVCKVYAVYANFLP